MSKEKLEGIEFSEIIDVSVMDIKLHPQFVHRKVDPADRAALEADIATNKKVNFPIYLQKVKHGQFYLLNGERRWTAAKKAGLKIIPARLVLSEMTPSVRRRVMHGANMLHEKYSQDQVVHAIIVEYGPERILEEGRGKGRWVEQVPLWREVQIDFSIHARAED